MLSSFFSALYEMFCGINSGSSEYRDSIYESVGLFTFIIAVAVALIFYLLLGRWKNVWYTRKHWIITLIIDAAIGFALAFIIGKNAIGSSDGYLFLFSTVNGILLSLYFALLSLVLKKFSIYSKRTPF